MATSKALHDTFGRNVVFSLHARLNTADTSIGAVLEAIDAAGARVGELKLSDYAGKEVTYEIQIFAADDEQALAARDRVGSMRGARVMQFLDAAMEAHRDGSSYSRSRRPIQSNTDLRIVYTPGVARVCKAIEAKPALARTYTAVANKVAIVTNGTAILGLGDIGALAGLPVMEGKAAIFWEFAGISAEPLLIETHDADEFINVCKKVAIGYGAIQVEDVAAPECFRITRELDAALPIPVFHDDQHGTATIVLAGLYSAVKQTQKDITKLKCAISGAGAAGTAIADLLMQAGVPDVVLTDRAGILHPDRKENMNSEKLALARRTNPQRIKGGLAEAMAGRDLFIGVSQANIVSKDMVRSMAPKPLVFALANPISEISVADAYEAGAAIAADGRMMNNALAYPGIFRGALDANVPTITQEMLMAAAKALATCVPPGDLMPEMMDPNTHKAVADAVKAAAAKGGGRPLGVQ